MESRPHNIASLYLSKISRKDETDKMYDFFHSKKICFVRRRSDGYFLRGAKYWKWTRSWRAAAMMSPDCFRQYFEQGYLVKFGINRIDDVEFLTEVNEFSKIEKISK